MAAISDYFARSKSVTRTRPPVGAALPATSPSTPRTPLLGRTISSQFGSPGSFRTEQEDAVIYELDSRCLKAGFAGESRPRCELWLQPQDGRRAGDFRIFDGENPSRTTRSSYDEGELQHELFSTDVRSLDLGLVADKLERLVANAHIDYLQLDSKPDGKPRKAILIVPSLFPTPLLEIALRVLFNHSSQPPTVTLLTAPVMACASAGLRSALVVDIGWEETIVTAVGEYREMQQRRSVRAGKRTVREIAKLLNEELEKQLQRTESEASSDKVGIGFEHSEDVRRRLAWCRPRVGDHTKNSIMKVPAYSADSRQYLSISIDRFAEPVQISLFGGSNSSSTDDEELLLPELMYNVLLSLQSDIRAICMARIVLIGAGSDVPGLHRRLLQELEHLIATRGWDPVRNYGSMAFRHRNSPKRGEPDENLDPEIAHINGDGTETSTTPEAAVPPDVMSPAYRPHDDIHDEITKKAEREAIKGKIDVVKGVVQGVRSLGAWSGASLVASLRVKGLCEVEREDLLKHGMKHLHI